MGVFTKSPSGAQFERRTEHAGTDQKPHALLFISYDAHKPLYRNTVIKIRALYAAGLAYTGYILFVQKLLPIVKIYVHVTHEAQPCNETNSLVMH